MKPLAIGKMDRRITFASREAHDDGYGNTVTDFADRFTVWAGVRYLRGSEAVIAARLESRQPAVIHIRRSAQTALITTDWRAADTRTGEVFNIRTIVPTDDRTGFELTVESGVAS